jgi:hypothetical protein
MEPTNNDVVLSALMGMTLAFYGGKRVKGTGEFLDLVCETWTAAMAEHGVDEMEMPYFPDDPELVEWFDQLLESGLDMMISYTDNIVTISR